MLAALVVSGRRGALFLVPVLLASWVSNARAADPVWTAESNQASSYFSLCLSGAGDVNADGYDDVIVSAPYFDGPKLNAGRAYVYQGSAAGLDPAAGWTADGDQENDYFGENVSSAGDVDGDGFDDVAVGAWGYDGYLGRASVYLGSSPGLAATAAWTAESDEYRSYFGRALSSAGDVNGDGFDELLVGAYAYTNGQLEEGRAYLYTGSAAGLSASAAWTAESNQVGADFGIDVASAGDVNGDGFDDVVVGAQSYDFFQGRAFVYHGSPAGLSATEAWSAGVGQPGALFGWSASSAGDVNGDGYADVVVGALYYSHPELYEGGAWVYLGGAPGLAATAGWTGESDQASASYGFSVSSAGDLDSDGYGDIAVGADLYSDGQDQEGKVYVYLGTPDGPEITASWTAESDQTEAQMGEVVASAGDVDGDGYGDLLVGAYLFDGGEHDEGRASLFSCSDGLDSDGDLVGDWCDVCPGEDDRLDLDLDGVPDGCDVCPGYDDALDADADTVPDGCDACPGHDDLLDADLDLVPDACDVCPDADDGLDSDGDGVADGCDACPDFDDASDADLDGIPDACDPCPGFDLPGPHPDSDSDGTIDACDACPGEDDRLDADLDGVPDGCDVCASGDDHVDTDADGQPDACDPCPLAPSDPDLDGDGYALCNGDCWEGNAAVFPGAPEVADGVDQDCDGRVDEGTEWADDDLDGVTEAGGDCDDADPAAHPGALELCDGIDQDCDGLVDEGTECFDDDGDGYTEQEGDCADADPLLNPGALDLPGDGLDNDCDGEVDPGTWDPDGDGAIADDCAPNDPAIFPGNVEIEDGLDNDCDGAIDEGTAAFDDDGDGYTEEAGDCDDSNIDVSPGAAEIADHRDDDCDGVVDEGTETSDDDGDGQTELAGDCDDADPAVYAGAPEVENGVDDDCDGAIDENAVDLDRDGATVEQGDCDDQNGWMSPRQAELCDGIDNDCDGLVDEGCSATEGEVALPSGHGCATGGGGGIGWLAGLLALRRRGGRRSSP